MGLISAHIESQALITLPYPPDYLFKDICITNSLGRQRWPHPLEQRVGMLTIHYKRFSFLKLKVCLTCESLIWCSSYCSARIGILGTGTRKCWSYGYCYCCKLYQVVSLANIHETVVGYNKGKTSDPSRCWPYRLAFCFPFFFS